jgi:aldose 1-epimerase
MPRTSIASEGKVEFLTLSSDADLGPAFLTATVIPTRALMLLQATARLADGTEVQVLAAPDVSAAAALLNGGPNDFMGNASFSFGGAVLAPFVNRIRGAYLAKDRHIETDIGGHKVRLPANGGGKKSGSEQYAIHGLILATRAEDLQIERRADRVSVTGTIQAGDFGVGWPSSTHLTIAWTLQSSALSLKVVARNVGAEDLPIGLGWHPYFSLPGGKPEHASMRLPARTRILVNNYDEVLPTGELTPVADTAFDFSRPGGKQLGDLYLDDCFADIERNGAGETICEIWDRAADYGLRIISPSPQISAIQTFRRSDSPFVVIEPQFSWADPFGTQWEPGLDTGMVWLGPEESVEYMVRLELFTPSSS